MRWPKTPYVITSVEMDDAAFPCSNSGPGRSPNFGSLSSSLGRKLGGSADNLKAVAAEAERKLKNEGERIKAEWQHTTSRLQSRFQRHLHTSVGFEDWPDAADAEKSSHNTASGDRRQSRLRRVRTFGDFRRGSRLQSTHEHEEGGGWDLAAAVNNALSKRHTPGPGNPLYLGPAPIPSLKEQQVKALTWPHTDLVGPDACMSDIGSALSTLVRHHQRQRSVHEHRCALLVWTAGGFWTPQHLKRLALRALHLPCCSMIKAAGGLVVGVSPACRHYTCQHALAGNAE